MEHIKPRYTRRNFWYILLALALVVFLPFSIAAQQRETVNGHTQSATSSTQGDESTIHNLFAKASLKYIPYLTLAGIILLLVFNFWTRQSSRKELDSIKKDVKTTLAGIADIRSRALENTNKLLALASETKAIEASLNRIAEILQGQMTSQNSNLISSTQKPEEPTTPPQDKEQSQSGQSEPMSSVLKKFCELYNAGEETMRTRYEPHYRIGVNATERRRDPNAPPIFSNDTAGKFLAYYIEAEGLYAVVPSYGLVLQDSIYGPGAFGEVFECRHFDFQKRYHVTVIQPAFFELNSVQQQWTLKKKGVLELTPSE